MKRPLGVVLAAMVGGLALLPASGGAQTPGSTTLTFFESEAGSSARIVDNAPRSPVRNPENRRYRFSMGDQLTFSNPVLDRAGGTRVGTLYGTVTVVKGRTFRNIKVLGQVVFEFTDGSQITAHGVFALADGVGRGPDRRRQRQVRGGARQRVEQDRRQRLAGHPDAAALAASSRGLVRTAGASRPSDRGRAPRGSGFRPGSGATLWP